MSNLFRNELLKLRHSKAVIILFWVYLGFTMMSALVPGVGNDSVMQYGFSAPFLVLCNFGTVFFDFFAIIAAGLIAEEFKQGIIHNVLGCGVERGRYFIAKASGVVGISLFFYLCDFCAYCVTKNLLVGFGPKELVYSHYFLKVLVYNLAAVLLIFSCVSFYICLAYLLRDSVKTFAVALVVGFLDTAWGAKVSLNSGIPGGPASASTQMAHMIRTAADSDRILSGELVISLLPTLCLGVISILAAYRLFQKMDIQ